MSSQNIKFKIVAYTDAAGKNDPDAFRSGNEDNFYVDDNLDDEQLNHCSPDTLTSLSDTGMLMVVADGMGGMNAGEVASQIAVDTVKDFFSPGKITSEMASSHEKRCKYLEKTIKAADQRIKEDASANPEHKGMGSTIIMAWLCQDELSLSWCGDSRAYIFNQSTGIRLISEDHSYVQELVKKGMLTYEQTFDHPQNNIVTRSLGDPRNEAKPESRLYKVGKGDVILLCSDGLSGVLRDRKTYDSNGRLLSEDNLEDIIRVNDNSMKECREALWRAAERAGWYDNVTAILCKIADGNEQPLKPVAATKTGFFQKTVSLKSFLLMIPLVVLLTLGVNFMVSHIRLNVTVTTDYGSSDSTSIQSEASDEETFSSTDSVEKSGTEAEETAPKTKQKQIKQTKSSKKSQAEVVPVKAKEVKEANKSMDKQKAETNKVKAETKDELNKVRDLKKPSEANKKEETDTKGELNIVPQTKDKRKTK